MKLQKFYMPYMTMETLEQLKKTGTIKKTGYYSMFEYTGNLELVLFDRGYSSD